MKKPHEDDWACGRTSSGDEVICLRDQHRKPIFVALPSQDAPACVRLAAQAPAMARLLIEIQWSLLEIHDKGERYFCPACANHREDGHAEECELVAVLRAAGAIV